LLLDQVAFLDEWIAALGARAAELTVLMPEAWGINSDGTTGPDTGTAPDAPVLNAVAQLAEIPGVSPDLAQSIIAETGLDMAGSHRRPPGVLGRVVSVGPPVRPPDPARQEGPERQLAARVPQLGRHGRFSGQRVHPCPLGKTGHASAWSLRSAAAGQSRQRRLQPGGRLASHAVASPPIRPSLALLLDHYYSDGDVEKADIRRVRALVETTNDPWRRDLPLHVTASALIVHPLTARVLLRWHQRQQAWLQVGGHGDPGESDPLAIALREAAEETGLADLEPWPDARLRHLVIVNVPPGKGEPAHEHADLRYFMATQTPETARAENEDAPLRWLSLTEAREATSEVNLRESLARLERLLGR
jgi:8-oxo-dGTP pyrophosphatase MutT (NUDIX family)